LFSSIAIREDGIPVVATFDNGVGLRIARCTTPSCVAAAPSRVVDAGGQTGYGSSLTFGLDGAALVAYHDATYGALKFARVPAS
jgi:hypothetical protein